MNEKLEYANMLEIPVSTCSVTLKPKKKRFFKKRNVKQIEEVKNELVSKVNSNIDAEENENQLLEENANLTETIAGQDVSPEKKKGVKIKNLTSVTAFAIVGVLLAVIFLTNAFYPNSGLRVFLSSVFDSSEQTVTVTDERTFKDFSPVLCFSESQAKLDEGLITVSGEGSVYSSLDGVVKEVTVDGNGRYNVEIAHSDNFTSLISNLDFVYGEVGDTVYSNIPIGYASENLSMCFLDANESVITDYEIIDSTVVWGV